MKKTNQHSLFNTDEHSWWRKEWREMPEFNQEDKMPLRTIKVHFKNQKDVEKFSELINQNIYLKTKYVWFPEVSKVAVKHLGYIDEEE